MVFTVALTVVKLSCANTSSQTVMKSTALIKSDNIAGSIEMNWIEEGRRRPASGAVAFLDLNLSSEDEDEGNGTAETAAAPSPNPGIRLPCPNRVP